MKNVLGCLLIIGFIGAGVFAQAELDTTFNGTGIQTVSFGISASGGDVVIQPDNKIVMVGSCKPSSYQQCVARYNEDGSLDTSFAQQGFLVNFGIGDGSRVALQSDGRIVVGGSLKVDNGFPAYSIKVALARYTADGVLDSSFGGGNVIFNAGMGVASPKAMVLQPDGKVVIAGESTPWSIWPTVDTMGWIARYLPNGTPDTSFSGDGVRNITSTAQFTQTACTSITVQPDGKLLVGIRTNAQIPSPYLMRLNPDGSPDPTWGGGNGMVAIPAAGGLRYSISNLQVMLDGRIVGTLGRNIVRFNPDGSLDNTFDGDGIRELGAIGDPYDLAISASGRITMAGLAPSSMGFWRFAVYKFRSDGSDETGFGNNGLLVLDPISPGSNSNSSACAFDSIGRTVVVGNATTTPNRFTLVRLVAPPPFSVSVSGRVTDANGNGVANATVSTSGITAQTSPFGYYTLNNVETNRTYVFSVRSRGGAAFTKRTILVDDNLTNIDFAGQQLDSRMIRIDAPAPESPKSAEPSIRKP